MSILPKIEVPKYELTVPSTGQKITYRPYLVKEEKILLIALESTDAEQIRKAIVNIVEECTEDVDIKTLTGYDVEYIFVKLRAVSVGAKVELVRGCDKCDYKDNQFIVDLDKVEVKNAKSSDDLQIKLDDKLTVDIGYPKTTDKIEEHDVAADLLIAVVANSIDTIYYGEDTYSAKEVSKKELREFVEGFSTSHFNKITKVLLDGPYVGLTVNYTCKECGHEHTVELKGLIDFFM